MKIRHSVLILALFILLSGEAFACTGARPLAMGGGFIGLSDDANATYWNPAAIAFFSGSLESHTAGPRDVRYLSNNTEVLKLNNKKGIGFSDTYNIFGERMYINYDVNWLIPYETSISSNFQDWITMEERWQKTSYAQRVSKRSAVGVNLNIASPIRPYQIHAVQNYLQNLEYAKTRLANNVPVFFIRNGLMGAIQDIQVSYPSQRYDVDLSYKLNINKRVSFGILLQDIASWHGNEIPSIGALNPRAGIAYKDGRFKLALDFYGGQSRSPMNDILTGIEYRVNNKFFLRAGSYSGVDTSGIGWEVSKKTSLNLTKFGNSYMMGFSKKF